MTDSPPALVLGGGPAALAITRSLGRRGVSVAVGTTQSLDGVAAASRFTASSHAVPDPLTSPDAFVERLLAVAGDEGLEGSVLMATSDAIVEAIAGRRAELRSRYIVTTVGPETARMALDKLETFRLASRAGVPTPVTVSADEVSAADVERDIGFPCVLKPVSSFTYEPIFHAKWSRVHDADELERHRAAAREARQSMMIQQEIPGLERRGVSYNAYAVDGEVVADFTSRKIRNAPPVTGAVSVVRSEPIPTVKELGARLIGEMGYDGFLNIEFKQHPDSGQHHVLDINPRHNLSAQLAVTCGIDFPWMQYRHAVDGSVRTARGPAPVGVWWTYFIRDLRWSRQYLGRPRYSLRRMLRPYAGRHVDAVASLADPAPFFAGVALAVGSHLS